ncbi:hypothetical protein T10_11622 [Trichinella papuae]|uniref:Uncharacterized protein n=1 Tax=Trichinella papuae TaxID=268474 RepID=A0A0V1N277_9BILA|nr:hypothetical protein T10_11622 [Trichinella papuae]
MVKKQRSTAGRHLLLLQSHRPVWFLTYGCVDDKKKVTSWVHVYWAAFSTSGKNRTTYNPLSQGIATVEKNEENCQQISNEYGASGARVTVVPSRDNRCKC